jgi:hypothetical protein
MQKDQMCTYSTGQGYGHEWRKDEQGGMDRGPVTFTATTTTS